MADLELKLAAAHLDPMLAARIAERTAKIQANDANRKLERATALGPAGATDAAKATTAKNAALATAATQATAYDAAKTAAKTAHAATGAYAEEVLDLGRGVLVLRAVAEAKLQGPPPKERKQLKISDADCDAYAASYALGCAASDEATDLARQLEDYRAAHPALFAGAPGGEPPPVDPVYEQLKVDLAAQQAVVQTEMAKQGAIVQRALGAEPVTYYLAVSIATGEIVLGDRSEEGAAKGEVIK